MLLKVGLGGSDGDFPTVPSRRGFRRVWLYLFICMAVSHRVTPALYQGGNHPAVDTVGNKLSMLIMAFLVAQKSPDVAVTVPCTSPPPSPPPQRVTLEVLTAVFT